MDDLDAIYRAHAKTVYRFLLSRTHDPDLSEELTQETFCRAISSIERFDGSCKLSVWLCQIAKHLWWQQLRRQENTVPMPEEPPIPPAPSAEEELLRQHNQLELLRRMHALPPLPREVVHLRIFGGLSFREIGEVMEKSETWARVTFYRAKERLRKDV